MPQVLCWNVSSVTSTQHVTKCSLTRLQAAWQGLWLYRNVMGILQVQEALLQELWEPAVLLLQHCSPVRDDTGSLLYCGPRVRMGIFEGVPLRIQPHTSSGRADYFGRLVNRSPSVIPASALGAIMMQDPVEASHAHQMLLCCRRHHARCPRHCTILTAS